MNAKHLMKLLCSSALLSAFTMAGCQGPEKAYPPPDPVPPSPTESYSKSGDDAILDKAPEPTQNPIEEKTGLAIKNETAPVQTTRDQQAELVGYYHLDDVQMAVVCGDALVEYGLGDEVVQRLTETFSELGFRVRNASGRQLRSNRPEAVSRLAFELDADLLVVATGEVSERSRLGQMLSYQAEIRTTVYDASGQIVTTKEITKVGSRSSNPKRAAESALLAAADELGPYLVEQIVRKVDQNLIVRRLLVAGLRYDASVSQLIRHLEAQPGINEVRRIAWDAHSQVARFLVYLQPAARDNLGGYIALTPGLDVRIIASDRDGITAYERRQQR